MVPDTISTVSDFTVDGINSVPNTINTVTDFGVNSIRDAPSNTIRFVNTVPSAIAQVKGGGKWILSIHNSVMIMTLH